MFNLINKLALTALACGLALSTQAFSLVGPFDTYQTTALDYVPGTAASVSYYAEGGTSDIGGPQNLGEWYRWNTPRLYYAYDATFVDYFGSNGVRSIEQAIALFNALPSVSDMSANLTEFPLSSRGQNVTAYALGLLDLKSVAMTEILGQMGLWNPTRFVWTPFAEALPMGASCPSYDVTVLMRNFDPITHNPSAYVNNKLYTFVLFDQCTPNDIMDALEETADPTSIGGSAVADEQTSTLINPGVYFTGFSRDDAGGLRYLMSKHQVAVESLTTAAALGNTSGGGLPSAVGATPNNSPWNLAVAISLTNATILGNGSPWSIVSFNSSTNATNTLTITNVTTGTTTSNSGPFNVAGVEKITFIQVPYDSTIGINYTPFVDRYALTMYKNGQGTSQAVTRTVSAPDLVFAAGNLGSYTIGKEKIYPVMLSRTTPAYNSAVKGVKTFVNGPGTLNPSAQIVFSDIGPWNVIPSGTTTLGAEGLVTFWGSFDGSTNAPVVYPSGTSVQSLEGRLFP